MLKASSSFVVLAALSRCCSHITLAQIPDAPDGVVAGIAANYTEANVGTFALPDVLTTFNGHAVTDAEAAPANGPPRPGSPADLISRGYGYARINYRASRPTRAVSPM